MSTVNTVEMLNPFEAMSIPDIIELFDRGLDANPESKSIERWKALAYIHESANDPERAVFLARSGMDWSGFVVLWHNVNWQERPFEKEAWVVYVYSDGSSGVKRALLEATSQWMASRGISSIFSINGSGRSDEDMIGIAPEFEHEVVGSVIRSRPVQEG